MRKWFGAVLIGAMVICTCATAQPAPHTTSEIAAPKQVYVIRHLQKAEGDDPSLTAEGAANAERLAAMLADNGIVAVFATPTRRAIETAAPLATRLGLAITSYDPKDPSALAKAVAAAPGPVLVVGHSNTLPDLVARFGGMRPAPMSEQDYGTLFLVEADGTVAATEVR